MSLYDTIEYEEYIPCYDDEEIIAYELNTGADHMISYELNIDADHMIAYEESVDQIINDYIDTCENKLNYCSPFSDDHDYNQTCKNIDKLIEEEDITTEKIDYYNPPTSTIDDSDLLEDRY